MCGRFVLRATPEQLEMLFDLSEPPRVEPRFNIAPTQPVAIVRIKADGDGAPAREFTHVRWGLIPSWAKGASIGSKMINARSETVAEKPSYRAAFKRRRCLVPASGFYEWKKSGAAKVPHFIGMESNEPFAIAGLWETWQPPEGGELQTCTLLTTEANDLLAGLHDRMPVIIAPEDYSAWLGKGKDSTAAELSDLQDLLRPYPSEEMIAFPVSTRVNSVANEGADLVRPTNADFPNPA